MDRIIARLDRWLDAFCDFVTDAREWAWLHREVILDAVFIGVLILICYVASTVML